MKKAIMFLVILVVIFNVANARDSRTPNQPNQSQKSLSTQANPCYRQLVHRESNLWFTITNWGLLGSEARGLDDSETGLPAPSANFPGGSDFEYLFEGAIWVGGVVEGETLVSVGADGWFLDYEMAPDSCPSGQVKKIQNLGDQEFLSVYADTLVTEYDPDPCEYRVHKPLSIGVTQHSYSWMSPPYDDFVILDYRIKNIGNRFISKAYVGFYMDTDIMSLKRPWGFTDDITGFAEKTIILPEGYRKINFAWAADNDGDLVNSQITTQSPIAGIGFSLLSCSILEPKISYNWWISSWEDPANFDFGPWKKSNWDLWTSNYGVWGEGGKGTPCGDRAKYFLMSNGEKDYDQIYTCIDQTDSGWLAPPDSCKAFVYGNDIKFLYSFGPFDIPAEDSISFAVGIIVGDSLHRGQNPFDPENPDPFLWNLSFKDLISNLITAQRVYKSGYTLPPPGPPQNFKVVNYTDSTVLLSWSPKGYFHLKGYNVYKSSTAGEYSYSPANSEVVKDTFYLDKGLIEGNTYYYTVACVNDYEKEGKKSEELMVVAGKPNAPTGLTATPDKTKICLAWKPNSEKDVIGYNIYRKEEGGNYQFMMGTGPAGPLTSYCDKNIENGVVYYYTISAVDRKNLESSLSDSVFALSMVFDQGILLVDMTCPYGTGFVQDDSINQFYSRALHGYPFTYSQHDEPGNQFISLKELSPYPVCIVYSEGRYGPAVDSSYLGTLENLRKYLLAGGKLILAGRHIIQPVHYGGWFFTPRPFEEGDFAFDILRIKNILLPVWSCGKQEFIGTHSLIPPGLGDLEVDTARVNLSYPSDYCNLQGKLPWVGYFVLVDTVYTDEVIYSFNSAYDTSIFEGKPIGMRYLGEDHNVYFFDFPLYYIKEEQSVPLLHQILDEFGLSPTEVKEEGTTLPENYSLGQNYPNPFNPATTIPFQAGSREQVARSPIPATPEKAVGGSQFMVHGPVHTTLKIYNILGQKVRTLVDEEKMPGNYKVIWDGKDDSGKEVGSGIYFYQLKTKDYAETKKMVLLR